MVKQTDSEYFSELFNLMITIERDYRNRNVPEHVMELYNAISTEMNEIIRSSSNE